MSTPNIKTNEISPNFHSIESLLENSLNYALKAGTSPMLSKIEHSPLRKTDPELSTPARRKQLLPIMESLSPEGNFGFHNFTMTPMTLQNNIAELAEHRSIFNNQNKISKEEFDSPEITISESFDLKIQPERLKESNSNDIVSDDKLLIEAQLNRIAELQNDLSIVNAEKERLHQAMQRAEDSNDIFENEIKILTEKLEKSREEELKYEKLQTKMKKVLDERKVERQNFTEEIAKLELLKTSLEEKVNRQDTLLKAKNKNLSELSDQQQQSSSSICKRCIELEEQLKTIEQQVREEIFTELQGELQQKFVADIKTKAKEQVYAEIREELRKEVFTEEKERFQHLLNENTRNRDRIWKERLSERLNKLEIEHEKKIKQALDDQQRELVEKKAELSRMRAVEYGKLNRVKADLNRAKEEFIGEKQMFDSKIEAEEERLKRQRLNVDRMRKNLEVDETKTKTLMKKLQGEKEENDKNSEKLQKLSEQLLKREHDLNISVKNFEQKELSLLKHQENLERYQAQLESEKKELERRLRMAAEQKYMHAEEEEEEEEEKEKEEKINVEEIDNEIPMKLMRISAPSTKPRTKNIVPRATPKATPPKANKSHRRVPRTPQNYSSTTHSTPTIPTPTLININNDNNYHKFEEILTITKDEFNNLVKERDKHLAKEEACQKMIQELVKEEWLQNLKSLDTLMEFWDNLELSNDEKKSFLETVRNMSSEHQQTLIGAEISRYRQIYNEQKMIFDEIRKIERVKIVAYLGSKDCIKKHKQNDSEWIKLKQKIISLIELYDSLINSLLPVLLNSTIYFKGWDYLLSIKCDRVILFQKKYILESLN
eukprot:TRINITY_DN3079_c3_g1_i2.p1 TRINITY_DN3079_c3_g1~~TRINITY_DN3079_c3_g1_i2.p1  ORF type:complete len:831 (+),score=262.76 TRINITY_DN3079_c3_g1_i2:62-2554(+)